jgi:hypothetical protein
MMKKKKRAAVEQASIEQEAIETSLRKSSFLRSLFKFSKLITHVTLTAEQSDAKRSHHDPYWTLSDVLSSAARPFNAVVTTVRRDVSIWT